MILNYIWRRVSGFEYLSNVYYPFIMLLFDPRRLEPEVSIRLQFMSQTALFKIYSHLIGKKT